MLSTFMFVCGGLLLVAVPILVVLLLRLRRVLWHTQQCLQKSDAELGDALHNIETIKAQKAASTKVDSHFSSTVLSSGMSEEAQLDALMGKDTMMDDAMQATRDGLWDWDRSTDELHFNSRFLDMLGYSPDAFPQSQDTWRALLHPEDRERAEQRQQKMLESPESGDSFEHMFRLRAADGSYRWFLGQILNVRRDSDGRAVRVVGANVDITDLKNLRDKVEANGVNLQQALLSTCDGVWEWRMPHNTQDNAESAETVPNSSCMFTMLGRADHSLATGFTAWVDNIYPEDRDLAVALQMQIMNSVDNGDSAECTYRYKSGEDEYRWMLGRTTVMLRDSQGRAQRVVGVHTDVTELKALRSELEVRNERLNYAFAAARDGLWDWDVENGDVYYSPRYLSMMGYGAGDFAPQQSTWEQTVHPEDRDSIMANQARFINGPEWGDSFENTYRFRAADGSYRWILARALVVRRDSAGRGLRLVGLHTDVTEMRRTQESLRILLQHDSLTGLHSRAYFESRMATLRSGEHDPVSLIVADVDGLKLINDNLGHTEGDRLLVAAAGMLSTVLPQGAVAARIGGDEMAVLLPLCPAEKAQAIVDALRAAQKKHNLSLEYPPLYVSIGMATCHMQAISAEQLFRKADSDMLRHKSAMRATSHAAIGTWLCTHMGRSVDIENDTRTSCLL